MLAGRYRNCGDTILLFAVHDGHGDWARAVAHGPLTPAHETIDEYAVCWSSGPAYGSLQVLSFDDLSGPVVISSRGAAITVLNLRNLARRYKSEGPSRW